VSRNGSKKKLKKIEKMLDDIFVENEKLVNEGADVAKLEEQLENINLKIADMQCLIGEVLKVEAVLNATNF